MTRRVSIYQRIIVDIRIPIPSLHPGRDEAVRLGEVVDWGSFTWFPAHGSIVAQFPLTLIMKT